MESGSSSSAVVGASNPISTSDIFTLSVDCFEELFEWLTLRELMVLRRTCKRMKQVVNYYIKENYPLGFGNFKIYDGHYEHLRNFDDSFAILYKTIFLDFSMVRELNFENIKHILSKIENINFDGSDLFKVKPDSIQKILRMCENVKSLGLDEYLMDKDIKLAVQLYPKLENFALHVYEYANHIQVSMVQTFLERHPNIQRLSITLYALGDWMIESNLSFDILEIYVDQYTRANMNHVINQLNILHKRGFYKRLHIYWRPVDMEPISKLSSLEMLCVLDIEEDDDEPYYNLLLPKLSQLKVFYGHCTGNYLFTNTCVDNLANIEILHFNISNLKGIQQFLNRSTKLKEIKINGGFEIRGKAIDLLAWNKERRKCPIPSKVIIYVPEHCYLNTKHTKMGTKFDLIEVKRAETHIWEHEQNYFAFMPKEW